MPKMRLRSSPLRRVSQGTRNERRESGGGQYKLGEAVQFRRGQERGQQKKSGVVGISRRNSEVNRIHRGGTN
jgi:hypothetical protein